MGLSASFLFTGPWLLRTTEVQCCCCKIVSIKDCMAHVVFSMTIQCDIKNYQKTTSINIRLPVCQDVMIRYELDRVLHCSKCDKLHAC